MKLLFFISTILCCCLAQAQVYTSRLIAMSDSNMNFNYYDTCYYKYWGDRGNTIGQNAYYSYMQFDSAFASAAGVFGTNDTSIHTYDWKNNLLTNKWTQSFGNPIDNWYTDSFAYDTQGNTTDYFYKMGAYPQDHITYTYNSKNQLVKYESQELVYKYSRRILDYTYDAANYLTEVTRYDGNPNYIDKTDNTVYVYSGNNLIQKIYQVPDPYSQNWKPNQLNIYTYNGSRLASDSSFIWGTYIKNQWNPISAIIYDTSAFQSVQIHLNWNASFSALTPQWVDSSIYNNNNDAVLAYHKSYTANNQLYYTKKDSNNYDATHNLLSRFIMIDTGTGYVNSELYLNTYDQLNNCLTSRKYIWNDTISSWVNNILLYTYATRYYYEYYYTGVAHPMRTNIEVTLWPSPASNFILVQLTTDEKQLCTFRFTDLQGRLVRRWTEQLQSGTSERSIPVTDLPTGNYILSVDMKIERKTKKFSVVH